MGWTSLFGSFSIDMTVEVVGDHWGKQHVEIIALSRGIWMYIVREQEEEKETRDLREKESRGYCNTDIRSRTFQRRHGR